MEATQWLKQAAATIEIDILWITWKVAAIIVSGEYSDKVLC